MEEKEEHTDGGCNCELAEWYDCQHNFDVPGWNLCLAEIKSKLTSHRPDEDAHGAGKEIIKMETFESWLQDHHCRTHPEILDDDLPDAFSDWLVNLDPNEWIELGDKYGKSCRNGKGDI